MEQCYKEQYYMEQYENEHENIVEYSGIISGFDVWL